jgi:hypothetical protein
LGRPRARAAPRTDCGSGPFWEGGVLQTIGLGIVLALPRMLVLHRRAARYLLVAFALGFFALFSVSYPSIVAWLPDHRVLGRIFFFEFPPWPWIAIVWIGLALGWVFALQDTGPSGAPATSRA